ncbi:MAG: cytosol nonspecific dipeptidase [Oceanospirillales bacterium LUC14_002_19_P2]|nr:MAG: cytosol nonspecific dipeptidase [Oceanospirillales bacterium LUC14_002_19_P2]
MEQLRDLSPNGLWQWFETICSIPHPSGHEIALRDHIQQWAQAEGLETQVDTVGNLIIRKPATVGMEDRKGVILQAHLDMVPQCNADKQHVFEQDPITTIIDGEWVRADGTTLGADNGIGMASALAVMAAKDIPHGPLEVLLTINEEAGMTGAFGLQAGLLKGDILINTDSEEEGDVYMGCAGGVDVQVNRTIERQPLPAGYQSFELTLSGLKGGHSGCDIHLGRGNANKLLARFLFGHAEELELCVADIRGGSLRNAIPREAGATIAVSAANADTLKALVDRYRCILSSELAATEPTLKLELSPADAPAQVFTTADQRTLLAMMHAAPNGVIRMSDAFPGVVETSTDMGVVKTTEEQVEILFLVRSTIDSGRNMVENMLRALAFTAGADMEASGAYPGWKPDATSPVMQIVRDVYQEKFGKLPSIQVIHAGLECGLFKEPYPSLDMVSIGPTIRFPHSPDEKVDIASVGRYWELLVAVLGAIPARNA